jgi:hypothetical protein
VAFFAQVFASGRADCAFVCNGAMARSFVTAQEADAVYAASRSDPDAVHETTTGIGVVSYTQPGVNFI